MFIKYSILYVLKIWIYISKYPVGLKWPNGANKWEQCGVLISNNFHFYSPFLIYPNSARDQSPSVTDLLIISIYFSRVYLVKFFLVEDKRLSLGEIKFIS